jgi:hypothetical protein
MCLLVEKNAALASATMAQAVGLVGQVRSTEDRVRFAMDSVATFRRLQRHAGATPNWREVGSLRIALSDARAEEFGRVRPCAPPTRWSAGCSMALPRRRAGRAGLTGYWQGIQRHRVGAVLRRRVDGNLCAIRPAFRQAG